MVRSAVSIPPNKSKNPACSLCAAAETKLSFSGAGESLMFMTAATASAAGARMAFFGGGRHLRRHLNHFSRFRVVFIRTGIIFFHSFIICAFWKISDTAHL